MPNNSNALLTVSPNKPETVVWQGESQTLTSCDPDFLLQLRERGERIDLETLEIAIKVRDYKYSNKHIEVQVIYHEVATYALKGRRPRTVRDWVEAIEGFADTTLWGYYEADLTMSHFKAARRLYREGFIESPAEALDACINQSDTVRPLTVTEMETLFDPAPPANEQIAKFKEWLVNVLTRKAPFGWDQKKIERFEQWKKDGEKFLK